MMPSPAGCCPATLTSPAPETVYVIPASSPLFENTQMSASAVPEAGRTSVTGAPPSAQELLLTENIPSAATFKSTFGPSAEVPAVLGSTATMSFPVAEGAAVESAIASSPEVCGSTTNAAGFDAGPSAFLTWIATFNSVAKYASLSVVLQSELF